jgi:hypothetical protein
VDQGGEEALVLGPQGRRRHGRSRRSGRGVGFGFHSCELTRFSPGSARLRDGPTELHEPALQLREDFFSIDQLPGRACSSPPRSGGLVVGWGLRIANGCFLFGFRGRRRLPRLPQPRRVLAAHGPPGGCVILRGQVSRGAGPRSGSAGRNHGHSGAPEDPRGQTHRGMFDIEYPPLLLRVFRFHDSPRSPQRGCYCAPATLSPAPAGTTS